MYFSDEMCFSHLQWIVLGMFIYLLSTTLCACPKNIMNINNVMGNSGGMHAA